MKSFRPKYLSYVGIHRCRKVNPSGVQTFQVLWSISHALDKKSLEFVSRELINHDEYCDEDFYFYSYEEALKSLLDFSSKGNYYVYERKGTSMYDLNSIEKVGYGTPIFSPTKIKVLDKQDIDEALNDHT